MSAKCEHENTGRYPVLRNKRLWERRLKTPMLTRLLIKSFHALFGAIYLIAGIAVLSLGTGLLPERVREIIVEIGHDDGNTLHIMQEFGSLLVFVGLISFWFARHYDQSRLFHWAMTLFWGLFALVHWVDIRGSFRATVDAAITTIPFGLFVAVGVLRYRSERTVKFDQRA